MLPLARERGEGLEVRAHLLGEGAVQTVHAARVLVGEKADGGPRLGPEVYRGAAAEVRERVRRATVHTGKLGGEDIAILAGREGGEEGAGDGVREEGVRLVG